VADKVTPVIEDVWGGDDEQKCKVALSVRTMQVGGKLETLLL
jgi:hypothetical protein